MRLPRPGYLARKFAGVAATLFAVLTFNFLLFRILPGDPIRLLARAGNLSPEAIDRLRTTFGLDQPLPVQYLLYLRNLATGELGTSLTYRRPVVAILAERMENTLILLSVATVVVVAFGVVFGVYAAARRGTRVDSGTVVTSLVFWSLPTFWVGLIFVFLLGVYFRVLPISGMTTPGAHYGNPIEAVVDVGRHLVLPTLTLALVDIGQFILITRSSLIDVLTEDFILTAKAKGLSRRRVIWRHGVPNAMLPIVTATALYVSLIVGGTIQVETVFSYPGMGRLMYDAVLRRDYPVLEASFLLFAVTVIFANLASDLLYRLLDPRVRDA